MKRDGPETFVRSPRDPQQPGVAEFRSTQPDATPGSAPASIDGRLVRYLLESLGDPPVRISLWNGDAVSPDNGEAIADVRIANRASLLRLLTDPELQFGECFCDATVEVEGDLVGLLEVLISALSDSAAAARSPRGFIGRFRAWLQERGGIPRALPGKFNGHAYLLYPGSGRGLFDDGLILIGDAAGLAYPRSGEGIRPAVESALMAADIIRNAAGRYSRAALAPYADRLAQRFGTRGAEPDAARWLPRNLRQSLAARMLSTAWFARNVVVDRWFLHAGQRALVLR